MQVGSDVCESAEALIVQHIPDLVKGGGSTKVEALVNYYLYDEGGSFDDIMMQQFRQDMGRCCRLQ